MGISSEVSVPRATCWTPKPATCSEKDASFAGWAGRLAKRQSTAP